MIFSVENICCQSKIFFKGRYVRVRELDDVGYVGIGKVEEDSYIL